MPDMTITALRTTLLRVPWPQTPWLKGHAFGDARNLLVLDVETRGGIVGMGYLFPSMVRRSANEVKALALVSAGRLEPGEHRGQHPGPGYAVRQAVGGAISRVDPSWTAVG